MVAIWSCDQDHLNKLSVPHPKESEIIGPVVSEMFEKIDGQTDT